MGRRPEIIEDGTPLAGARIDVGARIGWLLRSMRVAGAVPLREMGDRLSGAGIACSAASLSRVETGGLRSGMVIDGYERVLGLEPGRLRAVVDSVCRTFDYSPRDVSPDLGPPDLDDYSRAVASVQVPQPLGGDWLRFAREHEDRRRFGLPTDSMRPLLVRLASELNRAVGTAYLTRYEAIARLRCSSYGDLVAEVVREVVLAPDAQAVTDLMIAVSERPSPELLDWMSSLLSHPSIRVVRGAALAIENMRSVGGLHEDVWVGFAPAFAEAYTLAGDDRARRVTLTRVYKNLPPLARAAIRARLTSRLEHVRGPDGWDRGRRNAHLAIARDLAASACAALGQPEQPMLTRLLFELLYDFRGSRVGTSGLLVMASPFADTLHPALVDVAAHGPDETSRVGACGVISAVQSADTTPDVLPWLDSGDEGLVHTAYLVLGNAGVALPDAALDAALAGDPVTAGRALLSAGMSGHPRLGEIANDRRRPERVRTAAAWWLREGGRVTR